MVSRYGLRYGFGIVEIENHIFPPGKVMEQGKNMRDIGKYAPLWAGFSDSNRIILAGIEFKWEPK